MRRDACQATYVPNDPQARPERELRDACLDRSLGDQRAAIAAGTLAVPPVEVAAAGRDPADCTREHAVARLAAIRRARRRRS